MRHTLLASIAVLACTTVNAADLVVIVNPAASELSKAQIADIFLGKDASLTPIDLPESSALRAEFYKEFTGRDPSQVKAIWSRLVFSGKAVPPKEVADAGAVKKLVAANPKTVGYIDKSAVDGSVKVVTAP